MKLAFHREDSKSTTVGVLTYLNLRVLRAFVVNHPYANSVPFALPIALSWSKGAATASYPTVAAIPKLRSLSATHFS